MNGKEKAPLLAELLASYKGQIELLQNQVEDMRQQLACRDQHIAELLRLLTGASPEQARANRIPPQPVDPSSSSPAAPGGAASLSAEDVDDLFQRIELPEHCFSTPPITPPHPAPIVPTSAAENKKTNPDCPE